MEMHQVRYFLAVARHLNFTRAAEECHVAQPSLTRAIKLLEEELGGELFRRERNLSHLTDLGRRMQPLMQQCLDSAVSAKSLATSLRNGEIAPLAIALSRTVNIALIVPQLTELTASFKGLELKFRRGNGEQIAEFLKKGEAELAIAGPIDAAWSRLDAWPLMIEGYSLFVGNDHRLAGRNAVEVSDILKERLLVRAYCEQVEQLAGQLRAHGISGSGAHEVATDSDLGALLAANVGIAIAPKSTALADGVMRVQLDGLELKRAVNVYAVAGRARSPAAGALLKLLRAADWSAHTD
jgi:DNA-binding transcriptional LysR family regulator